MNPENFNRAISESTLPVIVDIWAPWCMPCRAMIPLVDKLEKEYAGKVSVLRLNADESPEVLKSLNVFGIPTMILYKNGQQTVRRVGAQSAQNLEQLFKAANSEEPAAFTLALRERFWRLAVATLFVFFALQNPSVWWYWLIAGLLVFSAVYDRCPIWRAISPRLKRIFSRT